MKNKLLDEGCIKGCLVNIVELKECVKEDDKYQGVETQMGLTL